MDSNHTYLAVIILYSALKKRWKLLLQVFLKKYKYTDKKVVKQINNNLSGISFFGESDGEFIRIDSLFKRLGGYF